MTVCFGQLYQQRMTRVYKGALKTFWSRWTSLKSAFSLFKNNPREFSPDRKGPYLIKEVLCKRALNLTDVEGKITSIIGNATQSKDTKSNAFYDTMTSWENKYISFKKILSLKIWTTFDLILKGYVGNPLGFGHTLKKTLSSCIYWIQGNFFVLFLIELCQL